MEYYDCGEALCKLVDGNFDRRTTFRKARPYSDISGILPVKYKACYKIPWFITPGVVLSGGSVLISVAVIFGLPWWVEAYLLNPCLASTLATTAILSIRTVVRERG